MKTYDASNIRNVLLVGHGGAGKTSLLEAMLFTSGAITRMGTIEDGNTVSDHDPEETRKGISVSLSMAPVEWEGVKVNVLDAPGYADFIGDLRSAIRASAKPDLAPWRISSSESSPSSRYFSISASSDSATASISFSR